MPQNWRRRICPPARLLQAAQAARDIETMELLRQRYASDKAKIEAEREAKKDRVRGV